MVRIIDPGKMNVYLKLQKLSTADDGAGGTAQPVWEDIAEFWGELIQGSRGGGMRDTQMFAQYDYRINTYWTPGILDVHLEKKRVVTDTGKTLYIEAVENIEEKNMYAVLYCRYEK